MYVLVSAVVGLAVAYYFGFIGGGGVDNSKKIRSIEVGSPEQGASKIRRSLNAKDKLRTATVPTLYDVLKNTAEKHKDRRSAGVRKLIKIVEEEVVIKGEKKKWQYMQLSEYSWITYGDLFKKVLNFASGLRGLGIKKGDIIAIFEDTRLEWTVTAHAAASQSIVVATIYANLGEEGLEFALQEGEVTVLLANGKALPSILKIQERTPKLKTIIYVDEPNVAAKGQLEARGVKLIAFDTVESQGAASPVDPVVPKSDDLAVIMYTSGSTGAPKGVMISHKNLITVVESVIFTVTLVPDDVYISYLPLAHVLALAAETSMIRTGASFGYANPRSLLDANVRQCRGDLPELAPTLMAGVPTVWDRVRKGALHKVEHGNPIVKFLFNLAYNTKAAALPTGVNTPLADIIFKKFRDTLGGRLRLMLSGGAPLSKDTHEFLRVCFGVPVIQGYGLTETCGGASLQDTDDITYGVAGTPMVCTEIKLVDVPDMGYSSSSNPPRGEVWLRGDNVVSGYFKNPSKTAEDFHGGWFATGDVGQFNPNGTLSIIDRKKNLVKLSHGEYIALERLESIYKGAALIDNVCVYGDSSKPFPIAIVHPAKPALSKWAEQHGFDAHDFEALCRNPKVEQEVLKDLSTVGRKAQLKTFELVKSVILTHEEWTPENGLLTAAMKIKRQAIQETFKQEIAKHVAAIEE